MKIPVVLILAAFAVISVNHVHGAFGSSGDRVLLSDIKTLTLYNGRMTQGRRSSPVPQLKCVGGSAAGQFVPQVVQCYNRGSDGFDIQWECKTDMDNSFRFGQVEVTCEGYDYPEDPFILRGSCGLEYTLEHTKEGFAQKQEGHQYYPNGNSFHDRSHQYYKSHKLGGGGLSNLIGLAVVCLIIYGIYKTCLTGGAGQTGYGDGHASNMGFGGRSSQPPPPGFRPEFMPGSDSCGSTYTTGGTAGPGSTGGGGFWTGAATGGLLGYLFGRNNTGYNTHYHQPPPTTSWWGSGWGSGYSRPASSSWFSGSSRPSSPSTGTRTASGFGGTKRR